MTVEDGTVLDSRQPTLGDRYSEVTNRSLASSLLWWSVTTSLCERLLDSSPKPEPFAMVIGPRSVVEIRADDTQRRTRLSSLLRCGIGEVKVATTDRTKPLPDGYQVAHVFESSGETLGTVGIAFEGDGARWRWFDAITYHLRNIGPAINAAVVVDAGQPSSTIEVFGSDWFERFEQQWLYDSDAVLLMPHTAWRERLLRAYVDWIQKGRPKKPMRYRRGVPYDPAAPPDPMRYACPVPVEARFGVTGLIRNGEWTEGAELEAARKLVQSRFDLKLGIWDLADNPTLRQTLLDVEPPAPVVKRRVQVPDGAFRRAEKRAADRREEKAANGAARAVVMKAMTGLEDIGWEFLAKYGYYRYPLTPPVRRWPYDPGDALGSLSFDVTKKATKVVLRTRIYNDVDVDAYLAEHREAFATIAAPHSSSVVRAEAVLLELAGGHADEVNWTSRVDEIQGRVPLWSAELDPLFKKAMAVIKKRLRGQSVFAYSVTIGIRPDGDVSVSDNP